MSLPSNVPFDQIPWVPPPKGVTSNFDDPESRAYQVYISVILFTGLMLPVVFLRIYTRARLTKNWGWDDSAILAATVFALTTNFMYIYRATVYVGRHTWDTRLKTIIDTNQYTITYVWIIVYIFANICMRLAILFLDIRLFGSIKIIRYICYATVGWILLYNMGFMAGHCYVMAPGVKSAIMPLEQGIKMGNDEATTLSWFAGVNIATDLFLISLPIYPVRRLYINKKSKWKIYAVFGAGAICCGCSLGSLILRVMNNNAASLADSSWTLTPQEICQIAEINLGIICACLPLVAKYFRELFSTGSRGSNHVLSFIGSLFTVRSSRSSRDHTHHSSGNDEMNNRQSKYGGPYDGGPYDGGPTPPHAAMSPSHGAYGHPPLQVQVAKQWGVHHGGRSRSEKGGQPYEDRNREFRPVPPRAVEPSGGVGWHQAYVNRASDDGSSVTGSDGPKSRKEDDIEAV